MSPATLPAGLERQFEPAMSAATCEPPEEHRGEPWHWLRREGEEPEPVRWHDWTECWERAGYWLDPKTSHAHGWRYVGPVLLPQEGE